MKNEPLVTAGTVTAFVAALIGVLAAFGADITEDQKTAVLVFVGVVGPLLVAALVRGKVTPVANPKDADGNALTADITHGDAV